MLTEFGSDAFNVLDNAEDQKMQAYYMVSNWKDIYLNAAGLGKSENAIGGFTFQFSDGWSVANRVRNSVLGRKPESEVSKVLLDVAGINLFESIREDPGFDTMLATAKPLRFQGRGSKAQDAIARLAKKASEYLEE